MEIAVIQDKIYDIRCSKVMLDFDLSEMYKVETHILNQAVKHNIKRFLNDFMFQLNGLKFNNLKSQITHQVGATSENYRMRLQNKE
jgi:DNA-binding protein Fis